MTVEVCNRPGTWKEKIKNSKHEPAFDIFQKEPLWNMHASFMGYIDKINDFQQPSTTISL